MNQTGFYMTKIATFTWMETFMQYGGALQVHACFPISSTTTLETYN